MIRPIDRFPVEAIDKIFRFQDEQWREEDFFNQLQREYFLTVMPGVRKAISELRAEMRVSPPAGITRDMIEQAKEYPITELIGAPRKKGLLFCINHKERHPSLWVKNNYAYCFGCHWHGDSIDVYMLLHGVSFEQAVEELCGRKN